MRSAPTTIATALVTAGWTTLVATLMWWVALMNIRVPWVGEGVLGVGLGIGPLILGGTVAATIFGTWATYWPGGLMTRREYDSRRLLGRRVVFALGLWWACFLILVFIGPYGS